MLQALYRFYDANDCLLYVGISSNWIARLRTHEKQSHFFVLASKITLEQFATREAVEAAEIKAIEREKPVFNKRDNPPSETWQSHMRDLMDMATGKLDVDSVHDKMFTSFSGNRWLMSPDEFLMSFRGLFWHAKNYNVHRPRIICSMCEELLENPSLKQWQEQLEAVAE